MNIGPIQVISVAKREEIPFGESNPPEFEKKK